MLFKVSTLPLAVALLWASTGASALAVEERSVLEERSSGIITNCKKSGQFALTFDDGPGAYGASIAKIFEQHQSKTTFFLNGNNYGCIYDSAEDLQRRFKAGHTIAAHTWSHDDVTTLTTAQLNKQMDLIEVAFKKIFGIKPRLFRPPYGNIDDRTTKIIESRGYKIVTWMFDSGDSTGTSPSKSVQMYKDAAKLYPKPQLAINHETYAGTGKTIVPQVVPMLISKGYKLVTVDECLGIDAYQSRGSPSKRDNTWTCNGTPGPGEH